MWWNWEKMGGGVRRHGCWKRHAFGWLTASALSVLVAGCFPALSEPGAASGGENGEAVGGRGGSAGMFGKGGKHGWAGAGAASSRGGAGPVVSSGGSRAMAAGTTGSPVSSVGGSSAGVTEATGGSPGGGGEPQSAGTSASTGGTSEGGTSEGGTSEGGSAQGGVGGSVPSVNQAEIEAQTIERWNAIADDRDSDTYSFHWMKDMFPHPTFAAMGEADGYREFAFVLDEFLGTNFDFLAQHRQFLTPYYYVTASPADTDLEVTWDELATDFSTMTYGDIPDAVQERLATRASNMKAYE